MNNSQGNIIVTAPFNKYPNLKATVFNEISGFDNVQPNKVYIRDNYKPIKETKVLIDTDTKNQAEIIEAYKFKNSYNIKDEVAINLLNKILGGTSSSRLFNDLREKQQLAYHVGSSVSYFDNTGILILNIGTTTENKETNEISYDNVQKSINGFNKHINRIKTEKVSQEELQAAKLSYKNALLSNSETNVDKTEAISINSFYGPLTINEILKVIDEITVDDIYNAANYVLAGKPTYSILATENTLKANEQYLKDLAV